MRNPALKSSKSKLLPSSSSPSTFANTYSAFAIPILQLRIFGLKIWTYTEPNDTMYFASPLLTVQQFVLDLTHNQYALPPAALLSDYDSYVQNYTSNVIRHRPVSEAIRQLKEEETRTLARVDHIEQMKRSGVMVLTTADNKKQEGDDLRSFEQLRIAVFRAAQVMDRLIGDVAKTTKGTDLTYEVLEADSNKPGWWNSADR